MQTPLKYHGAPQFRSVEMAALEQAWENPVKDGVTAVKAALSRINAEIPKSRISTAQRAQVQLMANQAQDIITAIQKDGS